MKSSLSTFSFDSNAFVDTSKNLLPSPSHKYLLLYFLLWDLWFLLLYMSLIYLELIFVYCVVGVTLGYHLTSITLKIICVLSWFIDHNTVQSQLATDEWLHFGALSSIPLCLCLYYIVYYCRFVVSFEKDICEVFRFVLLFLHCFGSWSFFPNFLWTWWLDFHFC